MRFDLFQVLFPQQLGVLRGHKKALGRYCVEKALFFQFVVGALGGNHADAQVPRQTPDGGHGLIRLQCTLNDLILDLGVDLVIDGRAALVVDIQFHEMLLWVCVYLYIHSIYGRYSFVKRVRKNKSRQNYLTGFILVKTLLLCYSMVGTVFQFPSGVAHKRRRLSLPAPKRRARRFFL